ncbi:MAG TPA: ABC transporter ATP-binding protein [Candidatus Dormibacteraeota bacterium]|nr:ABC transporter ATP-binding protein [Candidatus Dormibacteraeota bacterium]
MSALAEAREVTVRFGPVTALEGVSLAVPRGSAVALIGESGSGKTTLGLTLLRVHRPAAGRVLFDGLDVTDWDERRLRFLRPRMQLVFQDPYASLDPHLTVGRALAEALWARSGSLGRAASSERVEALLAAVGLPPEVAGRRPHLLSGGQRQRVGIARALAPEPDLLVADEPVSALDVSTQAQIAALLAEVRRARGLTLLLITHDLALAGQLCERVAVLHLGQVVETGSTDDVVRRPQHPFTAVLLSATPDPDPRVARARRRIVPRGEPLSPVSPPPGCRFHPRCQVARDVCRHDAPSLREVRPGHLAACHFAGELPSPLDLAAAGG